MTAEVSLSDEGLLTVEFSDEFDWPEEITTWNSTEGFGKSFLNLAYSPSDETQDILEEDEI